MPVYETNEYEIINGPAKKVDGEKYGTMYLTNFRIIYEISGRRSFLKAVPSRTDLILKLTDVVNVSYASPRLKLKSSLRIEYNSDNSIKAVDFYVKDAVRWFNEIKKASERAKREEFENIQRMEMEKHLREMELARAKTPNVGVAFISGNKSMNSHSTMPALQYCPVCNHELSGNERFCPNCGYRLS
ncbi:zinc ribbon domain-containing protein [Picrophilus oshimae]|uniref:Zinc-ribbon domain-containing protein n=1 Tax=Picrophilus torridus (strain ATCC 700027 / DSM 9790 / JCM 10055 / NBRC 100828 / KAW 2/3) TaxID=1122961 RepID=Q6KZK2_PICTO|nr:zinc ribbon domain-containing protein [Picrophilus oshimae]AAT43850.1 hypothetical protein PTO1265 [Picrophilus oshimae DSM 9789]SMD31082.1 zinc-ribbon domain-containing protein [Picrophilus oshimae DSM 9789]